MEKRLCYLFGKERFATDRLYGSEQLSCRRYDHLREVLPDCTSWTALPKT